MSDTDQFPLVILLVALAAYLRLRIDWSKERIRRTRKLLLPMLFVELVIVSAAFLQVWRIYSMLFVLPDAASPDPTIPWTLLLPEWFGLPELREMPVATGLDCAMLGAFWIGVRGLALLYLWQLKVDWTWIRSRAGSPPEFLELEAITQGGDEISMKIRITDLVKFEKRTPGGRTDWALRTGADITVQEPSGQG